MSESQTVLLALKPWLMAWSCFKEGVAGAPPNTPFVEVAAFADELKRKCPYWPPPAEAMEAIQRDWLLTNPGEPLPPALFGARHGLWVPGTP